MKNFPWQGTAIGCGILTVLVLARCLTTIGFVRYYGGTYWMDKIMTDPWFYIGMTAAAFCAISLLVLADRDKKEQSTDNDGCEA